MGLHMQSTIVVKDIEKSRQYYRDLFGLEMILDNDGNMILTDRLVLQAESCWKKFLNKDVAWKNNASEFYFEETNLEDFVAKPERLYAETVSAIVEWALKQPEIRSIVAETEESNIASQKVLLKAGFIPTGDSGEEGPIFACIKKKEG